MPHLTLQISAGGPILDLIIGPSVPRLVALNNANQPIPGMLKIRGLVDTGASQTCVDPACLSKLGLSPTGFTHIHTPSTRGTPHRCNQFDVQLVLIHAKGSLLRFESLAVVESSLMIQGIQALIGRDVLSNCLLVYDGAANIFSIAF